jgi:prolyl-tRNA editing enzyme YbaK/EbsC (Cys-tRNA(Pro) deacylase)
VDPVILPFWDIIRSRRVRVLGRRRLHHLTRGPYQASERIPAPLSQIITTTIAWCGNRPLMILSTADVRLNLDKFFEWFGFPVRPATSVEVSVLAGTHLQGSPPGGLAWLMPVFLDHLLLEEEALWVPAGDPSLWVCLAPHDLLQVTSAYPVDIRLRTDFQPALRKI